MASLPSVAIAKEVDPGFVSVASPILSGKGVLRSTISVSGETDSALLHADKHTIPNSTISMSIATPGFCLLRMGYPLQLYMGEEVLSKVNDISECGISCVIRL